jgi:hypothetical protein
MKVKDRSTVSHSQKNKLRKELLRSYEDTYATVAQHGEFCVHCGRTDKLTLDHIVPLSRGGTNHNSNMQLLCRRCNSRKSNRMPGDSTATQAKKRSIPVVTFEAPSDLLERFDKVVATRYTNRSAFLRELMAREADALFPVETKSMTGTKDE